MKKLPNASTVSAPKSKSKAKSKPKILVIVGPTAAGKTSLSIALAQQFNCEIISADSRQVYRGLDIGSGKVTRREMQEVPHHLLNVASPRRTYTVTQYQKQAQSKLREIISRGRVPIIVGGTGFYLDALVNNYILPAVPPNPNLRRILLRKSVDELYRRLQALDLKRAATIDRYNPRRLIRAIEIATALGKVPEIRMRHDYNTLKLGVNPGDGKLKTMIKTRLEQRLKKGLINEVKRLHAKGLSWKRLYDLGLEYRFVSLYLRGELSKSQMVSRLEKEIMQYAKRQLTWFHRDKDIVWLTRPAAASKLVRRFLLY